MTVVSPAAPRKTAMLWETLVVCTMVFLAGCSNAADGNSNLKKDERDPVRLWTAAIKVPERAFRGAVGYGAESKGGRGGRIIDVTNLADSGKGSLRACIDADVPRICIFRVSGIVRFTTKPPIVHNPYITIAGQTAPGDGITIAHGGGPMGLTPLVIKNTHDVIVRHIRVRNDRVGGNRGSEDSITIDKSERVIIDHVSATWARDELINGYDDNNDITVSNSLFAYGIPRHDKCALLGSNPTDPQNFSFIGNICAHNGDRNPDINFPPKSCIEIVNNIFYDAQSEFAEVWESYGGTPVALVGNYFKAGPSTSINAVGIVRQTVGSKGLSSIYIKDNFFEGDFEYVTDTAKGVERPDPPCRLTVNALSADDAYRTVLANAGAWPRDSLDREVVHNVRKKTGRVLNDMDTLEIPNIAAATPYPDSDRDGMDDRWEVRHGANPRRPDAWADSDKNGVSNLEDFLDYLDASLVGAN
jgi:pectate lyase